MKVNFIAILLLGIVIPHFLNAQIVYEEASYDKFFIGSYGRIGVDWNYENKGSVGRRLNLNNMGSIGGRMEEQDYLELATGINFTPKVKSDSMNVRVQTRFSFYSRSLNLFGNSSSTDLGGLTFAIPELYIEARGVGKKDLFNVWVGSRLYRGPDVHIADCFYFNDHSGQGAGVEYKNTRLAAIMVFNLDTTATVPPYFYLNIKTGTPSLGLRQRSVLILEQDQKLSPNQKLTYLLEYHRMGDASEEDTVTILNYPSDHGFVFGLRHHIDLPRFIEGSFNDLAIRYGNGIANGGDGGVTRTYLTFGAPNLDTHDFRDAYSWALVNQFVMNLSNKFSLHGYLIYNKSKGAAESDDMAETYFGKEVFNRKEDFTVGTRGVTYFSDTFHLLTELHYSQRKDGTQPWYRMTKISLAPTLSVLGERNIWARPHLRFVFSLARYNQYASDQLYSPYLEYVGNERWGYYLGIKGEYWIWR